MYVRLFPAYYIDDYFNDDIEKVPLKALFPWNANKDDSDFSVFKLNSKVKSTETNNIVLRAIADNIDRTKAGVDLLILTKDFLNEFCIRDDKKEKFNCLHSNIKNLTYADYKKFIFYTYHNKNNCISYTMEDIRQLLLNFSTEDYKSFLNYYDNRKNKKYTLNEFIEILNRVFLEDGDTELKYVDYTK